MKNSIYFLFLFFLVTTKSYSNSLYYGGFSFGSLIPEKTYSYLLQESNNEKLFLNKVILESTQEINNDSFKITYDLLESNISEDDQNILVFALDNEYINHISIPQDKLTRTDIVLNFNIIIFNAKNNFLVASIPLEITKTINSHEKLSKNQIVDELKKILVKFNLAPLMSAFFPPIFGIFNSNALALKFMNINNKKDSVNFLMIICSPL